MRGAENAAARLYYIYGLNFLCLFGCALYTMYIIESENAYWWCFIARLDFTAGLFLQKYISVVKITRADIRNGKPPLERICIWKKPSRESASSSELNLTHKPTVAFSSRTHHFIQRPQCVTRASARERKSIFVLISRTWLTKGAARVRMRL